MVNKIHLISGLKRATCCRSWRKFSSNEERWALTLISNSSLATFLPSKKTQNWPSPCLEPPTDKKQILLNEQHHRRFQLHKLHVAWANIVAKWSFTNVRCDAQVPRLGCRNNKESGIWLIHILPADGGVIYSTCNLHRSALPAAAKPIICNLSSWRDMQCHQTSHLQQCKLTAPSQDRNDRYSRES